MKTIEQYEITDTVKLQSLLKKFEKISERNEILIEMAIEENTNCEDLQKENSDYAIDISLIRMELNRRLWSEES